MKYKSYTITAEVETYETWALNEKGEAVENLGSNGYFEITGYHFTNEKTGDDFFQAMSASGIETLHELVDDRLKEMAQ